jgi:hypothetical protein
MDKLREPLSMKRPAKKPKGSINVPKPGGRAARKSPKKKAPVMRRKFSLVDYTDDEEDEENSKAQASKAGKWQCFAPTTNVLGKSSQNIANPRLASLEVVPKLHGYKIPRVNPPKKDTQSPPPSCPSTSSPSITLPTLEKKTSNGYKTYPTVSSTTTNAPATATTPATSTTTNPGTSTFATRPTDNSASTSAYSTLETTSTTYSNPEATSATYSNLETTATASTRYSVKTATTTLPTDFFPYEDQSWKGIQGQG